MLGCIACVVVSFCRALIKSLSHARYVAELIPRMKETAQDFKWQHLSMVLNGFACNCTSTTTTTPSLLSILVLLIPGLLLWLLLLLLLLLLVAVAVDALAALMSLLLLLLLQICVGRRSPCCMHSGGL